MELTKYLVSGIETTPFEFHTKLYNDYYKRYSELFCDLDTIIKYTKDSITTAYLQLLNGEIVEAYNYNYQILLKSS